MPIALNTLELSDWSDATPIATGAAGHRDDRRIAFRLTLTAHAGGVYPVKRHHYRLKFREDGSNAVHEWDVEVNFVPDNTNEPFDFLELKPRSGK